MADSRGASIIPGVRKLALIPCTLICAALAVALAAGTAGAAAPTGTLSVEQGKGAVTVEIRGTVIGRLGNGSVRITDQTPRDRHVPVVAGRRLTVTRVGPKTVLYKGNSLRFRMHGSSKIVVKGNGISLSAVGRGFVTLDGDRKLPEDNAGFYSLDGVDCSYDIALCVPLPDLPERYAIGPTPEQRGAIR
jgi:hypothetical protein